MTARLQRRSFLALAAAAAAAAPLPAFAAGATLRAGSAGDDDVTPFLYAIQSGIFKKAGIEATIQRMNSGSAVAAGVAGGSFEVGKSSLLALIAAHARNVPLVIIAPAGEYNGAAPIDGLLVKADSPIKTGADLNGKTIAVSSLNDLYTISTKAWVDAHGGDSSTLKLVELPISAVPEAIAQGRIDAGNVLEPELEFALESKKVRVVARPLGAIAHNYLFTAWFTTKDFAARNRETVTKFIASMREAAQYTNAHHGETREMLAGFTKVDPAVIFKSTRSTAGTALDPKAIQPVIETAYKYKAIAAPFNARDLIDPESLRA